MPGTRYPVQPKGGGAHRKVSDPSQRDILTVPNRRPLGSSNRCCPLAMTNLEYPIIIEPLPETESGGFVALVPDLPGCMSDGETAEAALASVKDAVAA
jgi:hypothetical protein